MLMVSQKVWSQPFQSFPPPSSRGQAVEGTSCFQLVADSLCAEVTFFLIFYDFIKPFILQEAHSIALLFPPFLL